MIEIKFGKDSQPIVVEDGKVRKQSVNGAGYMQVQAGGKKNTVHRLVACAFIENPLNKSSVNHKNGDKLDNSINNLEWVTVRENNDHAMASGLSPNRVSIEAYSDSDGCGFVYPSIRDVANGSFDRRAVQRCLNGKFSSHKGYAWSKIMKGQNHV
jgi:hypothetical protein